MAADNSLQRLLNEAKQEELHRRFGAEFGSLDPSLPPAVVRAWLDRIEEFEQRCSAAQFITVREFIGNPPVRPPASLPADEVMHELECLIERLRSNNIAVHFGRQVPPAEAYRFLVEEILSREIEDIRMEDLTLTFSYEEFHSETESDVSMSADDFFRALFTRDRGILFCLLPPPTVASETGPFRDRLERCLDRILFFMDFDAEIRSCTAGGPSAVIQASVTWTGIEAGSMRKVTGTGTAVLHLISHENLWYVCAGEVPGLISG